LFKFVEKCFCFRKAQGYPWRCKFLQRWRCNCVEIAGLAPDWEKFAQWVIVYFGNAFIISEIAHIFGLLFPQLRLYINFDKNVLGYILGNLFHKLIRSPCSWPAKKS
jgi:hypothetical protein